MRVIRVLEYYLRVQCMQFDGGPPGGMFAQVAQAAHAPDSLAATAQVQDTQVEPATALRYKEN